MEQRILTLLARTPVHVGAGNSVGAVDSPVMRERHTRIPIVPGSSLKGVLRDLFSGDADTDWLFGTGSDTDATAGALLIGEARVLAFPVRSARGGFAWITCPLALSRFKRDSKADFEVPYVDEEDKCRASKELLLDGKVVLEEYCLKQIEEPGAELLGELKEIIDDAVWQDVGVRLAVISDEMFCYFVEHACEVVTRVRIDDATGTVAGGALFNQENVPSETLFYAVVAAQTEKGKMAEKKTAAEALDALRTKLVEDAVIQVGGDETIGLGYCSVAMD